MNFTLISSQSWLKKTFLTHCQNNLDFKKTWVFHMSHSRVLKRVWILFSLTMGVLIHFFSNQRIPLGGHSVPGGTIQASGRTTLATERIWVSENDDGSDCNPTPVVPAPSGLAPSRPGSSDYFKPPLFPLFLSHSSTVFRKLFASCDTPWVFIWFRVIFIIWSQLLSGGFSRRFRIYVNSI